jgi:hypothetical protein
MGSLFTSKSTLLNPFSLSLENIASWPTKATKPSNKKVLVGLRDEASDDDAGFRQPFYKRNLCTYKTFCFDKSINFDGISLAF